MTFFSNDGRVLSTLDHHPGMFFFHGLTIVWNGFQNHKCDGLQRYLLQDSEKSSPVRHYEAFGCWHLQQLLWWTIHLLIAEINQFLSCRILSFKSKIVGETIGSGSDNHHLPPYPSLQSRIATFNGNYRNKCFSVMRNLFLQLLQNLQSIDV